MSTNPVSPSSGPSLSLRRVAPSLVLNAVLPYILFQILSQRGVPTVSALCATSVFPIVGTLFSWVRTRHADGIGIVSLVFIAIGIVASLISNDVHFYLVKESFVTGLFGLACLGSLLLPRPIMFYFARQFSAAGDPERLARFNGLWQYPAFRHGLRLMTLVWGVSYVAEALVRVALAYTATPSVVLAVSPILATGVTIALFAWTFRYGAEMRRRGEPSQHGAT